MCLQNSETVYACWTPLNSRAHATSVRSHPIYSQLVHGLRLGLLLLLLLLRGGRSRGGLHGGLLLGGGAALLVDARGPAQETSGLLVAASSGEARREEEGGDAAAHRHTETVRQHLLISLQCSGCLWVGGLNWQAWSVDGKEEAPALAGGLGLDAARLGLHTETTRVNQRCPHDHHATTTRVNDAHACLSVSVPAALSCVVIPH